MLSFLSKYSFGIFFFHGFFTFGKGHLVSKGVIVSNYAGYLTYIMDFTVFVGLSILICLFLWKLFGKKSRYLTGVSQ
jgi:hypothetical protein